MCTSEWIRQRREILVNGGTNQDVQKQLGSCPPMIQRKRVYGDLLGCTTSVEGKRLG